MMTDPIADMLTRIRNALAIERPFVDIPSSNVKVGIAEALQREGYIWDFEVIEQSPQNVLRVNLKYGPNGERVIQHIQRVSKPGRRQYQSIRETQDVLGGLGIIHHDDESGRPEQSRGAGRSTSAAKFCARSGKRCASGIPGSGMAADGRKVSCHELEEAPIAVPAGRRRAESPTARSP